MGELSPWHLLILAAVFVLLFGAKKLPDAARSIGRSMRILRAETSKGMNEDEEEAGQPRAAVQQAPSQQAPQQLQQAPQQPQQPVGDGTVVSGAPLSQAQRDQQPS